MPEIKNTFTQGKMNKDLDERIIPNGQYREAFNVKVSVSDESNVGTVQNVLGNKRVDTEVPAGFKCIGSISDEKNNKLYWFVTGTKDAILQYDLNNDEVKLVIVDTKINTSDAVLKFTNKIITGINVIDNLLFFTDGLSEPKKVNIKNCIDGTTTTDLNLATHTELVIDGVNYGDIKESHITVIRKNPKSQLDFIINKPTGQTTTKLFEKIFPRFSYRYKYQDNEYSAYAPFTNVVFNASYDGQFSKDDAYSFVESYNTAMVNKISSVELKNFRTSDTPDDVVQIEILYRQEGTNVIYSVKRIDYDTDEWNNNSYLVKSESIYAALPSDQLARVFDAVPTKALAQEITGNRLVYGNYTQGHDLTIPSGDKFSAQYFSADYGIRQTTKSFDNEGIESIKSQRKYQVGFVLGDKYGRETPVFTSEEGFVEVPWINYEKPSIGKSASEALQITAISGIGVNSPQAAPPSWAEYYKYYIKETSSEYYNLIMDKAYIPSRINLYDDDEDHIWLGFPSSDRSKITEEDFIILKKKVGGNENQINIENKFKVISIENEAPDQIKFEYLNLGQATQSLGGVTNFLTSALMDNLEHRINRATDMIYVNRAEWINECKGGSLTDDGDNLNMYVNNMYLSFYDDATANQQSSEKYKVVSILFVNNNYQVKLNRQITENDQILASSDGLVDTAGDLKSDLVLKFERKEQKDLDEFSGKFFVKVVAGKAIVDNIENDTVPNLIDNFAISIRQPIRWYVEEGFSSDSNPSNGLINQSYPSYLTSTHEKLDSINSNNSVLSTTQDDWSAIMTANSGYAGSNYNGSERTFFIDNAYFASSQSDHSDYVKFSGQGYKGNYQFYDGVNAVYGYTTLWGDIGSGGFNFQSTLPDTEPQYPNFDIAKDVNGLEGFVITNNDHSGFRAWKSRITGINDPIQSVYSTSAGKYYLHISFLGPGIDLHDGFSSLGLTPTSPSVGPNSISDNMQGIWGGGYFSVGGDTIYFEGNFDANEDGLSDVPGPNVPTAQGYDGHYEGRFLNQWNPAYPSSEDPNGFIRDFVSSIRKYSKFKFSNDTSNTVIEIISDPVIKKLYNHTPWRAYKQWDGTPGSSNITTDLALGGDSVEEAAITYLNNKTQNNLDALTDRIEDFGRRNNRRTVYIFEIDQDITTLLTDNDLLDSNGDGSSELVNIDFLSRDPNILIGKLRDTAAIWETEPKTEEGLDIYYEASSALPFVVNEDTNELLAPKGSRVEIITLPEARNGLNTITEDIFVQEWPSANTVTLTSSSGNGFNSQYSNNAGIDYSGAQIRFYKDDGGFTTLKITSAADNPPNTVLNFNIQTNIDAALEQGLSWNNCFSFGNGIESDRIRDDFNTQQIGNGVRASIVSEKDYEEENRKHGLIYSGIYNSTSSINNLNQFILAERITKDLNPTYGSIQKLFQRRISLIAFCEDRVVSINSNKDTLFNADGNPQLISSTNVLGDATPFVGDFGISKNPESFAKESYRAYFTDKQRGAVLRLSMDGLTPISEAGMSDYFRDTLKVTDQLIGSYDNHNKYYNLTISGRLPGQNLIANSSISSGQPAVPASNVQLITNSSINGTSLTLPSISAANDNESDNSTLESKVVIANYHPIPKYSILPESTTSPTTQTTNTAFVTKSFSSGLWYDLDFSHNPFLDDNDTNWKAFTFSTIYQNNNSAPNGFGINYDLHDYPAIGGTPATTTDASKSGKWWNGGFYSGLFGPSNDVFWQTTSDAYAQAGGTFTNILGPPIPASNQAPWFNTTGLTPDQLGFVFDGLTPNTGYLMSQYLWLPGDTTGDTVTFPNLHKTTLLNNVPTVYPTAKDNSIFNGEEVIVRFKFRNPSDINFGATTSAPHSRAVHLTVWNNSSSTFSGLPFPYYFFDETNNPAGLTNTDYSTYHTSYTYDPASPARLGYHGDNNLDPTTGLPTPIGMVVEFPYFSDNNIHEHEVRFKFSNGTENEQLLFENVQFSLYVVNEDGVTDGNPFGSIWAVQISKVFRLDQAFEQIVTPGTGNNDGIPSSDIPGWASVIHSTENWGTPGVIAGQTQSIATYGSGFSNATLVAETSQGNTISYPAPPGTTIDSSGYGVTNIGTVSNGTVVYNDNTGGTGMYGTYTNYALESVGSTNTYGGNDVAAQTFFSANIDPDTIKTENTGVCQIDQDFSSGFDFVADDWYVVDLLYTGGVFTSSSPQIKIIAPIDTGDNIFTPQQVDDFYPTVTNVYRCLFQATAANQSTNFTSTYQGGNQGIKINTVDTEINITDIHIINVTSSYQGGTAPNWNINGITQPINYFSVPEIYVDNTDGIVFTGESTSVQNVRQVFPTTLPQTTDGYVLEFEIKNNVNHLQVNGLTSPGELKVTVSNGTDNFAAIIDHTLPSPVFLNGVWKVEGKLGVAGTNNIYHDNIAVGNSYVAGPQPAFNGVEFSQTSAGSTTMVGSVDNVTLVDKTNYFTSGSQVGSFSITGFDQTLNNYIDFTVVPGTTPPDGQIFFNQAPALTPRVQIEQPIGSLNNNESYRLRFNHANISGVIKGYYFNSSGNGFRFTIPSGTANYQMVHVIGDHTIDNANNELVDTFVIYADPLSGGVSTGSIDNLILQQVFPLSEVSTISYSERVRGWVSFKSFIAEQGVSLSNNYYTFYSGGLFKHDSPDVPRAQFYGIDNDAYVTAILNDSPSIIKNYLTLNYEGDNGWFAEFIKTDKQQGSISDFIEKEGKYFNFIKGVENELDTSAITFQGLGTVKTVI